MVVFAGLNTGSFSQYWMANSGVSRLTVDWPDTPKRPESPELEAWEPRLETELLLLDPARAELTADEILGERELITELTMLLWSADPLDLVKLDTFSPSDPLVVVYAVHGGRPSEVGRNSGSGILAP